MLSLENHGELNNYLQGSEMNFHFLTFVTWNYFESMARAPCGLWGQGQCNTPIEIGIRGDLIC
jgi:hypothetical protein